ISVDIFATLLQSCAMEIYKMNDGENPTFLHTIHTLPIYCLAIHKGFSFSTHIDNTLKIRNLNDGTCLFSSAPYQKGYLPFVFNVRNDFTNTNTLMLTLKN